jgi:hypothetical protein
MGTCACGQPATRQYRGEPPRCDECDARWLEEATRWCVRCRQRKGTNIPGHGARQQAFVCWACREDHYDDLHQDDEKMTLDDLKAWLAKFRWQKWECGGIEWQPRRDLTLGRDTTYASVIRLQVDRHGHVFTEYDLRRNYDVAGRIKGDIEKTRRARKSASVWREMDR